MDGEDGLDVAVSGEGAVLGVQIDRDQGCMPVVCVDDVGEEIDLRQQLQHGFGEVGEAFSIVVFAVGPAPFEILLVVDEVISYPVGFGGKDAAVAAAPA